MTATSGSSSGCSLATKVVRHLRSQCGPRPWPNQRVVQRTTMAESEDSEHGPRLVLIHKAGVA